MTSIHSITKTCSSCKQAKNDIEFYKDKLSKDGLKSQCKICNMKAVDSYSKTKTGVATIIYICQLSSSKKRNHVTPSYTKEAFKCWLFSQDKFHILFDIWVKSGYEKLMKPSVDRLDDYKGYSFDNIQIITWQENNKKSHADKIAGINNKDSKAVIQLTKSNNFISKYFSQAEASRKTGVNQRNISSCCSGLRKTAGGFRWSYTEELRVS